MKDGDKSRRELHNKFYEKIFTLKTDFGLEKKSFVDILNLYISNSKIVGALSRREFSFKNSSVLSHRGMIKELLVNGNANVLDIYSTFIKDIENISNGMVDHYCWIF